MIMKDRVYDILRFVAEILLPALATLVAALGEVWGFEYAQIVGTISAVDVFLGAFVAYSKKKYDRAVM